MVLTEHASALGDDLDRIIRGDGPMSTQLRRQYYQILYDRIQAAAHRIVA